MMQNTSWLQLFQVHLALLLDRGHSSLVSFFMQYKQECSPQSTEVEHLKNVSTLRKKFCLSVFFFPVGDLLKTTFKTSI